MDKYIIKSIDKKYFKWNIKTDKHPIVFDKEIYSISLFIEHMKLVYKAYDIIGKNIYDFNCTPLQFIRHNSKKNIYNLIKKDDNDILIDKFQTTSSMYIFNILNDIKPDKLTKYLIISRNHYAIDGILFYGMYNQLNENNRHINMLIPTNVEISNETSKYIEKKGISITDNNLDNHDIIVIDYKIHIEHLKLFKYAYGWQSYISHIIQSLKSLSIGGTLIINTFIIPNKMIFNFLSYIGCFFNICYSIKNNDLEQAQQLINNYMIYRDFKGVDKKELVNLENLKETMYRYDDTCGYNFNITDKKLIETIDISNEYIKPDKNYRPVEKYIVGMFNVPEIENEYKVYKEHARELIMTEIRYFTERINIHYNKNNKDIYDKLCKSAKIKAIYLAKKYKFPLLEWVDKIPENYIDKHLTINFKKMELSLFAQLMKVNNINFNESKTVKCDYCPELDKTKMMSEISYQYIVNNNHDKYKSIELYINRKYKELNKMLEKRYNININGQYVSRAWIKFQEMLHDTHLLDGFEDKKELKVFHICEAPGNFINSMDYYIKTKTNIKNYDWNAQSLSPDLSGLPDQYGFIKKTKDRWDMGPNKNGDILDEENMKYYIKKYSGVDFLISDCGATWVKNLPDNRNINIHQLFYALLIPGEGGGFVIKTFTMKYNTTILCLLYLACYIYGDVQLFKSNTNFWSYEIYIVGKHKKKITPEIENHIIKFLYNVMNLNKIYPIDELPNSFVENYESIIMQVVSYTSEMNKFLVFLANNEETWENVKPILDKLIKHKLEQWTKKYIL